MSPISSILLLAASASAQVTTSFWSPQWALNTDKIGFVGSILSANESQTVAVLDFDNGVDTALLNLGGRSMTMTFGPSMFAQQTDRVRGGAMTASDAGVMKQECHLDPQNPSGNVSCTMSYGEAFRQLHCPLTHNGPRPTSVQTELYTHSYSGRLGESGGIETITQVITWGPNTRSAATWCSDQNREEPYLTSFPYEQESLVTFQVIFTAGLEKISATQGASMSAPGPTITGSGEVPAASGASNSAAPEQTQNAAPMATFAPALVGLGAAAAAILL